MSIKLLDDALINCIAAGEVIERPASVVKELIENSLDAKAKAITIDITEGGKSMIKVIDDGLGMSEEDAKICFERHTTSKINNMDDLASINSLGFRGEALASIAAVSNMKIITRTKDNIEGTKILLQAGNLIKVEPSGSNIGTTIEIRDLFFNTPARRKYLKVIATELEHIVDIIQRYSLSYPEVSFRLVHNSELIVNSPSTSDPLGNIVSIYGKETAKNLLKVDYADGNIFVSGFVSKPSLTRADRSWQSIFVNKRYVSNKIISKAIYDAYHTLLFNKRHPAVILNVKISPEEIDVNVHPQKAEIRIRHESMVYDAVFESIRQTLQENSLIPELIDDNVNQKVLVEKTGPAEKQKIQAAKRFSPESTTQNNLKIEIEIKEQEEDEIPARILGQVHNSYIIAEDTDGLLIIDQHVAEERYFYELLMDRFSNQKIDMQNLLSPINIELDAKKSLLVHNNKELLWHLGFDIEDFGKNTFLLRSLPVIMGRQQQKELFYDILEEIGEAKIDNIKEKVITRMACRASVMQGEPLEFDQMKSIVRNLFKTRLPYTCPHGRPVIISLSKDDLDKRFKRKG